jgi:hypothetical protein
LSSPFLAVSARISKELNELERVVERCLDIWDQSESSGDDRYLDGVALNLQSFYTGLERIFHLIVAEVDQSVPSGPAWHQALLRQAATPIPQLRPAIITDVTRDSLDRYRGFRHVIRSVYVFQLDKDQIRPLVRAMREVFANVQSELLHFAETISQVSDSNIE